MLMRYFPVVDFRCVLTFLEFIVSCIIVYRQQILLFDKQAQEYSLDEICCEMGDGVIF